METTVSFNNVVLKFSPKMNLVTQLKILAETGGESTWRSIKLRRKIESFMDAQIFFKSNQWLTTQAGEELLETFEKNPMVEKVVKKHLKVSLRFNDTLIASIGRQLEEGQLDSLDTGHLLSGKTYVVGFGGPNTSKALHIGHLRNFTIGDALASVLSTAGASVVKQSLLGDIGRSVCEAMAGFYKFHMDEDPVDTGLKPDHFVNDCHTMYIREQCTNHVLTDGSTDPIECESKYRDDLADIFMHRWLKGDPDIRTLWNRIRGWALEGHQQTLDRLGIRIERYDCESSQTDTIPHLIEKALAQRIFKRANNSAIVYHSGRENFKTMIFIRPDGFPTEHARLLAVYGKMLMQRQKDEFYLDLGGAEWQSASTLHMELLAKLWPELDCKSHILVFCGMVVLDNAKINSSSDQAMLLDKLLDRLYDSQEVRNVAALASNQVHLNTVINMIVKSYFLYHPINKSLFFSWERLLNEKSNPGWLIARTWCRVINASQPSASLPPNDDNYRLAVLSAQEFPGILAHTARTLDLSLLTSYLYHFCENLDEGIQKEKRIHQVVKNILCILLKSLGLLLQDEY